MGSILRLTWLVIAAANCVLVHDARLQAQPPSEQKAASSPSKRFVAYAWSGRAKHITPDNIFPMYWVQGPEPNIAAMKAALDEMPPGHRVVFSFDLHNQLSRHPENNCRDAAGNLTPYASIWWDHGAAEVAEVFDRVFGEYHRQGGQLDGLVLDFEDSMSCWWIGNDRAHCRAIMNDPRFPQVAKLLGFSNVELVCTRRSDADSAHRIWNAVMEQRRVDYINRAVYEPVRKYYPQVTMSNYECAYNVHEFACPDRNGYEHCSLHHGAHVGTHQSASLYGWVGGLRHYRFVDGRATRSGTTPLYGAEPFSGLRHSVNRMRSMILSSSVPTRPWISHKGFEESLLRESDLYQELIFHVCLTGADELLFWNPRRKFPEQDPTHFTTPGQEWLLSRCLRELDELVGFADRKTLVDDLAGWYDHYLLTGMAAGGRAVWRFTPRLAPGENRYKTRAKVSPPTFRVGSVRIVFPRGTFYASQKQCSSSGFWVITPKDERPVISMIRSAEGSDG